MTKVTILVVDTKCETIAPIRACKYTYEYREKKMNFDTIFGRDNQRFEFSGKIFFTAKPAVSRRCLEADPFVSIGGNFPWETQFVKILKWPSGPFSKLLIHLH